MVSVQQLRTLVVAQRRSCWRLQGCIVRLLSADRINMHIVTHFKGSKMTAKGGFKIRTENNALYTCVCVCVYVYVRMYVRRYVCMYLRTTCMYACMYLYMRVVIYVCKYQPRPQDYVLTDTTARTPYLANTDCTEESILTKKKKEPTDDASIDVYSQ